jgi:hypothetical protein
MRTSSVGSFFSGIVERARLVLREVLALTLVHEEGDRFFRNRLQDLRDGVHQRRLAAGDQDEPIVEYEQTGLGQEIRVGVLAADDRDNLGAGRLDDAPPYFVAQGAQGR